MKRSPKKPRHALMTVPEAADVLGVSTSQVHRYVKKGILVPTSSTPTRFDRADVHELATLRAMSESDGLKVEELALRAAAIAARADRRLNELLVLMRVEVEDLDVTEQGVVAFDLDVAQAIAGMDEITPIEAQVWAHRAIAVTEEYLELLQRYVGQEEPWSLLAVLLKELYARFPKGKLGAELAYAARNLRNVAYFYLRRREGSRQANRIFPEGGLLKELAAMIF